MRSSNFIIAIHAIKLLFLTTGVALQLAIYPPGAEATESVMLRDEDEGNQSVCRVGGVLNDAAGLILPHAHAGLTVSNTCLLTEVYVVQ